MLATQSIRQSVCSMSSKPCAARTRQYSRSSACQASKKEAAQTGGNILAPLCFGLVASSLPALQAIADEVAPTGGAPARILGLPAQEAILLTAPVLLYTVFTIWRTAVNPNLKLQDFAFFLVTCIIVGNIASIIFFKIRYF